MRITNALRREQTLSEIQNNLARLAELQTQVATGKRFTKAEEDPAAAAQVLRSDRGIRGIDQFTKNATAAQVRLGAEEAVIKQVQELMAQATNFATSFAHGDPPYTATQTSQRQLATDQVNRILDQIVSLGNTKIGNEYIFAGANSTVPAFDTTAGATFGTYQGGTAQRQIAIADGVSVAMNHTGNQYLGPAIAALKTLRDAIDPANNQTEAQVSTQIGNVIASNDTLGASLAETGVIGAQIVSTISGNANLKNQLQNVVEQAQSIPLEETVAKVLSLQTTIQASYSATSRLISLNLTDYLG